MRAWVPLSHLHPTHALPIDHATLFLCCQAAAVVATSAGVWISGGFASGQITFSAGGAYGGVFSTSDAISNGVLAKLDHDNGALMFARVLSGYGSEDILRSVTHVAPELVQEYEQSVDNMIIAGVFRGDRAPPFAIRPTVQQHATTPLGGA